MKKYLFITVILSTTLYAYDPEVDLTAKLPMSKCNATTGNNSPINFKQYSAVKVRKPTYSEDSTKAWENTWKSWNTEGDPSVYNLYFDLERTTINKDEGTVSSYSEVTIMCKVFFKNSLNSFYVTCDTNDASLRSFKCDFTPYVSESQKIYDLQHGKEKMMAAPSAGTVVQPMQRNQVSADK